MNQPPLTPAERGRKGGKSTKVITLAKMRAGKRLQAAKARAESLAEGHVPTIAPLPAWMNGDVSGLPKKPPGKVET